MEGGSRPERENKDGRGRRRGEKVGSVLEPNIEPFVPRKGYDPNELRSWAKKTGFVSTTFSSETQRSGSGRGNGDDGYADLERGGGVLPKNESISPKIEIDPILGRTRRRGPEIEPVRGAASAREGFKDGVESEVSRNGAGEVSLGAERTDGNGHGAGANAPHVEPKGSEDVHMYQDEDDLGDGGWQPSPKLVLGLKDNPGYG